MQAYLIDPSVRQIKEIAWPGITHGTPHNLTPLTQEGDVLMSFDRDVMSAKGVFVIDHQPHVYLGQAFVLNSRGRPYLPLAALLRQVNWVSTLMVCNGAKTVIPMRPVL